MMGTESTVRMNGIEPTLQFPMPGCVSKIGFARAMGKVAYRPQQCSPDAAVLLQAGRASTGQRARARTEEKWALQEFGEAYRRYRTRTPAFRPRLAKHADANAAS